MDPANIACVRRFNRAVTRRIGALEDSYLARGRPLGEARLLYEIGQGAGDLRLLRSRLGLDSGYLSRLLRALERQGLVEVSRKPGDARVREASLTEAGRDEIAAYDRLSDALARSLLGPLSDRQQLRLVKSMGEVERLLAAGAVSIAVEPASSADAQACLSRYFDELATRFTEGFSPTHGEASAMELDPPHGWFLVARLDGEAVGCGALKRLTADVGEVKRVWCRPDTRGMGIASRIMQQLEDIAAAAGFRAVRLDTNRSLTEAHALYRGRGYREIGRYNDNPYAHHWFEKTLATAAPPSDQAPGPSTATPGR